MSFKSSIEKKIAQIGTAAEAVYENINNWQTVRDYMRGKIAYELLTPRHQEMANRYQFVINLILSGKYIDEEIIELNKNQFKISITQARNDVFATKEIFNTTVNIHKLLELRAELQISRDLMRKAAELQDFKSAAAFQRNRIALIKMIPEADEDNGDQFEGHQIEAVFDPRLIGAPDVNIAEVLSVINEKRNVKINLSQVTSIPYENINSDEQKEDTL